MVGDHVMERMAEAILPLRWDHSVSNETLLRAALAAIDPEFAALRESASEAAEKATAWQDIATAPRDRTAIILGWRNGTPSREGFYDDQTGAFRASDGVTFSVPPTHWQPLPAPPIATSIEKEPG